MKMLKTPRKSQPHGFTRADLAALLAILGLILPLQSRIFGSNAGRSSKTAACMANQQRLAMAWTLYSLDNSGNLVRNSRVNISSWCQGWLDIHGPTPDNTNTTLIKNGKLWPYIQDLSAHVCPADPSRAPVLRRDLAFPLTRSYSMNVYLNGDQDGPVSSPDYLYFKRQNEIRKPQDTFVFMDERFDSINDCILQVNMNGYPTNSDSTVIVDYPAFYHDNGAVLAFADEHVEHWIWSDPRTTPPVSSAPLPLNQPSPNNRDVVRIQSVSSYRDR